MLGARPAYSRLTMRVRPDMVDGHPICHGAYLFTLADSAFAYACNNDNRSTVASARHVDFLSPARAGELRAAEDSEVGSSTSTADLMADTVEGNPQ
ncbi:MAG: hotdog fold thioesterase [Candidatus Accumulibacter phosphatis]|nr:hotdog fold thioesterase [Candidatus Accumulibacter sp. ACC012]